MRANSLYCRSALLAATALLLATLAPTSAAPRVLPEGEEPSDRRLGDLRSLNDYFPFTPPETAQQWEVRAEAVRRRLLVALGLWPMPSPTPA